MALRTEVGAQEIRPPESRHQDDPGTIYRAYRVELDPNNVQRTAFVRNARVRPLRLQLGSSAEARGLVDESTPGSAPQDADGD